MAIYMVILVHRTDKTEMIYSVSEKLVHRSNSEVNLVCVDKCEAVKATDLNHTLMPSLSPEKI